MNPEITTTAALLGAVLQKLRTEKALKQADVAVAVKTNAATWSRIEKGETSITFEQLRAVCKTLTVTPAKLFELVEQAEVAVKNHHFIVMEGSSKQLKNHEGIPIVGSLLVKVLTALGC